MFNPMYGPVRSWFSLHIRSESMGSGERVLFPDGNGDNRLYYSLLQIYRGVLSPVFYLSAGFCAVLRLCGKDWCDMIILC